MKIHLLIEICVQMMKKVRKHGTTRHFIKTLHKTYEESGNK